MTCREKLELEHPDRIDASQYGGCVGCPDEVGYLVHPGDCWVSHGVSIGEEAQNYICTKCWDREIPETSNLVIGDEEIEHPDTDLARKILDSGNRREFETGAVRDIQEGKGRCDLMPLDVVSEVENNWIFSNLSEFLRTGDTLWLLQIIKECCIFGNTPTLFLEVAKHFEEGAKKYGENNWQKGIPVHCYIDSAVRHYLKFLRGDTDEPHDRAFCWNILCAIWTCKHKPELNEYRKENEDVSTT